MTTNPKKARKTVARVVGSLAGSQPVLTIRNFAHIREVELKFGDLTVLVGPQGAGKSLALQWLKLAVDGRQVVEALHSAGHPTGRPDVLMDLVFGSGMAPAWIAERSEVRFLGRSIKPASLGKIGDRVGKLFFVPAHRSMLVSDGWAAPFQKLGSDVPAVARLFSQSLYDQLSGKDAGTLFPVERRLKQVIRERIDDAIFHGGKVGMEEDAHHARRLRLVHGGMHLPFMTWTAGQREFTPMLLALYHLMLPTKTRKHAKIDWVVIEEPEMGLHPKAITATLLLVLELLWRGYRVVLSTHSPHVLTLIWMLQRMKEHGVRPKNLCDAFDMMGQQMLQVAEAALGKEYRVHSLDFDEKGKVVSKDISELDPESESETESGWGGLTEYSSRFGDAVRRAVNESET